jgi:hypothetical protein
VRTSCGCATAEAKPEIVPPGGKSSVLVNMDSLEVGVRVASITLETDSPATPLINLQLVAEGFRRPPYVFQLNADLYYHEGFADDEVRKVIVDTVVLRGVSPDPPLLSIDVEVLQIGMPSVAERPYLADADLLVRSFTFPVRFAKHPPDEGFSGEIRVTDRWNPGRVLRSRVFGERNLPIRAIPPRLVLDASSESSSSPTARLVARTRSGGTDLKVVVEGEDSPLVVKADLIGDDDRFASFRVSCKPGQKPKQGIFNLIVTPASGGQVSLTVPVQVRVRGELAP